MSAAAPVEVPPKPKTETESISFSYLKKFEEEFHIFCLIVFSWIVILLLLVIPRFLSSLQSQMKCDKELVDWTLWMALEFPRLPCICNLQGGPARKKEAIPRTYILSVPFL